MLKATLIVSQPGQATQEVESGESITSIGSALDNTVCLEDDAGVARYHAVIERRGDGFWLSDLGTRQGTKVNDHAVVHERELEDGDRITLGGECLIEFYRHESTTQHSSAFGDSSSAASSRAGSELGYAATAATGSSLSSASSNLSSAAAAPNASARAGPASSHAAPSAETPSGGMSPAAMVGAGVLGAVVLTGAAALLINSFGGGGCRPSARILTPLNGATLRSATTIRVEAEEARCIKRIVYQLDGREVASAAAAPYEATLDPARLSRFAAGNHVLTATVETTDGEEIRQPGEVYVALGAADNKQDGADGKQGAAESPAPTTVEARAAGGVPAAPLAAADVQAMAERLASQISGKSGYVFEREMTTRIQARANEFASAGAAERAARHRRVVVKAFSDRGLRPLLGFVLALSRSKFDEAASTPDGSGVWGVPASVARGYAQAGAAPAAADGPQRSAEVAAIYLKDLLGVFETENFDLAVACFGGTLEEAGALKQRLAAVPSAERRNFWRMVERGLVSQEQSERVVRFYAAGIVGENPQRFGAAAGDRPLSSLEY